MQSPTPPAPIRVLFVCLGNICRSPMAEAVFAHQVREAGLEGRIEWDSAGTGDWHTGSAAHPGTLGILAEKNIAYDGRARVFGHADLNAFDFIVTMDDENERAVNRLRNLAPGHRGVIKPLLSFAPAGSPVHANFIREVPDPYFDGGFDTVFDLVSEGCRGLLAHIRAANNF
jgi:protein-tyrosine phosphatase